MLVKSGSETSTRSSITCVSDESDLEKPGLKFEQPTLSGVSRPLPRVSTLARRIHGWSWQAFPIGMGTGAVYVTLSGLKGHPGPLTKIETVFFFINVSLFILNSSTLLIQALRAIFFPLGIFTVLVHAYLVYPQQSRRLINDPVKGVFVPLIVLSFATIVIGTINYGVIPGHISADGIYVLFWIYVFLSVFVSFPMLMIWYNKPHDVTTFTPAWAFLIFPMVRLFLTFILGVTQQGIDAGWRHCIERPAVIDPSQSRAVGVLFVGYFFQGVGFFMTMFYICIYILRIMTTGFMEGHQANGAFVACGPPGFTALALINLGSQARKILPQHNLVSPLAGEIWFSSSVLMGLLLFGLAIFFFAFGLLPYWFKVHKHLSWALTFPNVGWISTLRVLGDTLQIPGFFVLHTIMTVLMCMVWAVLFGLTVLAFWKGKIFFADEADVLRDESRKADNGIV
ncbi:voltage-dependent anion channel [Russula vinacea]|nr:voltage-dependent anion channel [Russula vinacea]